MLLNKQNSPKEDETQNGREYELDNSRRTWFEPSHTLQW